MASNKMTFGIGFNVDKTGLAAVKTELQQLKNLTAKDYLKIKPELDLGQAVTEVSELKQSIAEIEKAFAKSFNINLGSTNVSVLRRELENLNLDKMSGQFAALGSKGVQAWQSITTSILSSNLQLQKTETLLDKMATTMGNTIKWGIASSAMNTFTGSVQRAYGYVKNLDRSLNDIRIVSNHSAKDMAEFAVQANKAAAALGATTLDYTNASLIFYQQGLDEKAVAERTDAVIKMTNVTGEASEKVSDYMTAVWNNFADGSQTLEYYADVMTALGAATAASTEEIADGLEKFAAIADTVGLSYEYATSALATVVSETRQSADVVGTAFKTLFARIQGLNLGETLDDGTTLNKYSSALASVGINIKEQNGELKQMDDILDELGSKWDSLSNETQIALAQTVAGVRQYNQLVALMDNWDVMQENLATASNATGELQRQQDIYMDSLEGHLNQLTTSQERLYDSLFDSESFKDLIDVITGLVDGLGDFVDAIGGGGNALLMLGTIATKVFDKQIAQGLTNLINNSKIAATNMENLKAKQAALDAVAVNSKGAKGATVASEEHTKMMDYTEVLSPESIEVGERLIQIYSDLTAKTEELELKQKEAAEVMQSVLQNQDSGYQNTDFDVFQKAIAEGNPDASGAMEDFNAVLDDVENTIETTAKKVSNLFDEFTSGSDSASAAEEDLQKGVQKLQKELREIGPILSANLQKKLEKFADEKYFDDISNVEKFEQDCNEMGNIAEQALEEIKEKGIQVAEAQKNANSSAIEVVKKQAEAAKGELDNFFANLDVTTTIKNITDTASAIGGLFTAINAIQGLGSIWSNEDLSLAEKFAQTLFLTTTILTNLAPVIKGVQTAYKAYSLVKSVLIGLETKEATAKALNTLAENKNTEAKLANFVLEKIIIPIKQKGIAV